MNPPAETCDMCGGGTRATHVAELPSGGLLTFCDHCARKHGPGIEAKGGKVVDLGLVAATTV